MSLHSLGGRAQPQVPRVFLTKQLARSWRPTVAFYVHIGRFVGGIVPSATTVENSTLT